MGIYKCRIVCGDNGLFLSLIICKCGSDFGGVCILFMLLKYAYLSYKVLVVHCEPRNRVCVLKIVFLNAF